MQMIMKINGKDVEAHQGETILDTAKRAGIEIPTLCFDPDLPPQGSCRICVCEVNGKLATACDTPVGDNMTVLTESDRVVKARKLNLELALSRHGTEGDAKKNELLKLAEKYGVHKVRFKLLKNEGQDNSSPSIIRDDSKCILCGKCVQKCQETQGVNAICFVGRSKDMRVGTAYGRDIMDSTCVNCGQCTLVCPTGSVAEVDDVAKVRAAIHDPKKVVVVQTAPAVRASIGEEFGLPPGTRVTKKMVAALRKSGFDKVFDTDFTADLTIMEEGHELIGRLTNKGVLPMITSCSPGWICFIEKFYPDLLPHLSSCKSPQQMFGALAKTYYAKKAGVNPKDLVSVSIMPCTAKKFECNREEMKSSGFKDVDYVLTTREAARLMKQEGVDLSLMPEEMYDDPLGESTGAGVIFGATGGVMEAALRTAYEVVTGKTLENVEFLEPRGLKGIKEGSVDLNGITLNYAVAHGLSNARVLMDEIRAGKSKYHFIEIMACPGGCIGGGGQPIPTNNEVRKKRMEAIYEEDKNLPRRKSHENASVKKLYEEFLGKPLGKKSHHLLHTKYVKRGI